jgi:hypothetical protein
VFAGIPLPSPLRISFRRFENEEKNKPIKKGTFFVP